MYREGNLFRNDRGRWEFDDFELTSGNFVELCIDGHWILGTVESCDGKYYWHSRRDHIQVVLRKGIRARLSS
jgi:Domain of unknown function (DUF5348)